LFGQKTGVRIKLSFRSRSALQAFPQFNLLSEECDKLFDVRAKFAGSKVAVTRKEAQTLDQALQPSTEKLNFLNWRSRSEAGGLSASICCGFPVRGS
jgi:hypothetical protein